MITLILNSRESSHEDRPIAVETVIEFKKAIRLSDELPVRVVRPKQWICCKSYNMWRRIETVLPEVLSKAFFKLLSCCKCSQRHYFNVLLGQEWNLCFPHMLMPGNKSVYMFDAWPCSHYDLVSKANLFHLDHVFVSSSQAAERLQGMTNRPLFSWVPEGIDPERYQSRSYADKDIDVLELGRKYDAYHNRIVSAMESDGRNHLYEKTKGVLIFPTSEDLIDGLARTRISICVPSNITHPERSGDIETMTVRYLESMASRCLVVGHAPQEMIQLFGYNPVIEIDMVNPVRQLRSILDHFDDYIELIERNFQQVTTEHTWKKRWEQIAKMIEA